MNGKSHEFFAAPDDEDSEFVLLSTYFAEQLAQKNEALRDAQVLDTFDIPRHLLVESPAAENTAIIISPRSLQLNGHKIAYRPFQVKVLNAILAAESFIAPADILTQVGVAKSYIERQHVAIAQLYESISTRHGDALITRDTESGDVRYGINPNLTFVDRRKVYLTEGQLEKQSIIQDLCKQFNSSPDVLKELEDYAINPIEAIPERWGAFDLARHQIKHFKRLPGDQREAMVDELDDIIEACKRGTASEEDQKQAVVLFNKLTYSLIGFGHALVFSALGNGRTRSMKSPIRGFMANRHNSLVNPEEDAFALAELSVVDAIQTYAKERGAFMTHMLTQIAYGVRDGILDFNRHTFGQTQHEIKGNHHPPRRRQFYSETGDEEVFSSLPEPRTPEPSLEYEEIVRDVNAGPFVRNIFRTPELRPAEKLILSLSYGIYNEEFEGKVLQGSDGQKFIYNESFRSNPIFREGMTDDELSKMFKVSVSQIARLRVAAYQKVKDLMKSKLATDYSEKKWCEWIW